MKICFPHSDFKVLVHFAQKGPGYRVYIICNFTGNDPKEVERYKLVSEQANVYRFWRRPNMYNRCW